MNNLLLFMFISKHIMCSLYLLSSFFTVVFGRKKRGFVSSVIRQMIRVPYRALVGEYKKVEPGTLILVRHGESDWNANKTFTGWAGKSALYCFIVVFATRIY